MNLRHFLQDQLSRRSTREKILLVITMILGIYFLLFHSYFLTSFEQIHLLRNQLQKISNDPQMSQTQNLKQNLQEMTALNTTLKDLLTSINTPSLPWDKTLKQINAYAHTHQITLLNIDSSDEEGNYTISLSGTGSMMDTLAFLDFIENLPLIHLLSFDLSKNNSFSLRFQNHKILSPTLRHADLTPEQVFYTLSQSQNKKPLIFTPLTPQATPPLSPKAKANPQPPKLNLQAIFNNKAKINGQWISKGEKIKSCTLQSISSQSVILNCQNSQIKLTIKHKKIFK